MIKKLIRRILGREVAPKHRLGKRVEVPLSEHGIDRSLLDVNAVRVVETLQDAGYEAFVVGGAVRDLLLGHRPKDFDVATDATPEQVKSLFRRAFIIGRRFRIVHVIFGRGRDHEVIEVSTFRALLDSSATEQVSGNEKSAKQQLQGKHSAVDADGRVLRDNVWGPQIEDAARRDFTVNGMYYDPSRELVIDYHGGIADVKARKLRMIGDPVARYREDPVRILRALRFAAKLGFEVERKTREPLVDMSPLLENVPQSRMFDEMIKLLQTGHALRSLETMKRLALPPNTFPMLQALLEGRYEGSPRQRFIELALGDTDRRVGEGKPVAPSFLLACLLWHDVQAQWVARTQAGEATAPALMEAIDGVFDARIGDISGRGKLGADMREIWALQPRFERRRGKAPWALVEQPRFRAGFDFLRLRADVGEVPESLAEWWEDFSLGDEDERRALSDLASEEDRAAPKSKHSRQRSPARSSAQAVSDPVAAGPREEADASDETASSADAPAKRRRRRSRHRSGGAAKASEGGEQ